MSAAAYELFKSSSYKYFEESSEKSFKLFQKTSKPKDMPNKTIVVEESLSIKPMDGSRQLYRMNFYNTTSRIEVNGWRYQIFMEDDLPLIMECFNREPNLRTINHAISKWCESTLANLKAQPNNKAKKKTSSVTMAQGTINQNPKQYMLPRSTPMAIAADDDDYILNISSETHDRDGSDSTPPDINVCLICRRDTEEEMLECTLCGGWIHTECEDHRNAPLASPDYICPLCNSLKDPPDTANFTPIDTTSTQDDDPTYTNIPIQSTLQDEPQLTRDSQTNTLDTDGDEDATLLKTLYKNKWPTPTQDDNPTHVNILAGSTLQEEIQLTRVNQINIMDTEGDEDVTLLKTGYPSNKRQPQSAYSADTMETDKPTATTDDLTKAKCKKPKKKDEISQLEKQLAENRAYISTMESTNRDYQRTVHILSEKLNIPTPLQQGSQTSFVNQESIPQNTNLDNLSLHLQLQQLKSHVDSRLDHMQKELHHQAEIQDLKMKHLQEVSELKLQLSTMKLQQCRPAESPNHWQGQATHIDPQQRYIQPIPHPGIPQPIQVFQRYAAPSQTTGVTAHNPRTYATTNLPQHMLPGYAVRPPVRTTVLQNPVTTGFTVHPTRPPPYGAIPRQGTFTSQKAQGYYPYHLPGRMAQPTAPPPNMRTVHVQKPIHVSHDTPPDVHGKAKEGRYDPTCNDGSSEGTGNVYPTPPDQSETPPPTTSYIPQSFLGQGRASESSDRNREDLHLTSAVRSP